MNLPQSANARIRGQVPQNNAVNLRAYPLLEDPNGVNAAIQSRYEDARRRGESHNMAEMLAYRQPPGSRTDDDFFRGVGTLDKQLQDRDGHYINEVTSNYRKATGHDVNPNYVYQQGLAAYPGDPRAFVDGAGSVKRLAEERNVTVSGFVNHKASEPLEDPFSTKAMKGSGGRKPIANDLKQIVRESIEAKDPSQKGRISNDLIDAKHGNHVSS